MAGLLVMAPRVASGRAVAAAHLPAAQAHPEMDGPSALRLAAIASSSCRLQIADAAQVGAFAVLE